MNAKVYKKNYIPQPNKIDSRYAKLIQHSEINKCNPPYQEAKEKNVKAISINAEKAFHTFYYSFLTKTITFLFFYKNS